MKVHSLKTDMEPFKYILAGSKRFEFRKNDRDFHAGDILHLRECRYSRYTGRSVVASVPFIMHGPAYGIPNGYCVMTIVLEDDVIEPVPAPKRLHIEGDPQDA